MANNIQKNHVTENVVETNPNTSIEKNEAKVKFLSHFENTKFRYFPDNSDFKITGGKRDEEDTTWNDEYHQNGAFFTVNGFTGGQTKENLDTINGFYIDKDWEKGISQGDKSDKISQLWQDMCEKDIEPTYIVETQKGCHCHWVLDKPVRKSEHPKEIWEKAVEMYVGITLTLIRYWGADSGAKDVTRVLRIPNSTHWKDKEHPFTINIWSEGEVRYSWNTFENMFPPEKIVSSEKPELPVVVSDALALEYPKLSRPSTQALLKIDGGHIPEGTRNHSLHVVSTILRDCGVPLEDAFAMFPEYHGLVAEKGIASVRNTIRSAYSGNWTYGINSPYVAPHVTKEERETINKICKNTFRMIENNGQAVVDLSTLGLVSITKNKDGRDITSYPMTVDNIHCVLLNHPSFKNTMRFNTLLCECQLLRNNVWENATDAHLRELQAAIGRLYVEFVAVKKDMVKEAMFMACEKNLVNPAQEEFKAYVWDGVPRVDTWTNDLLGCPDNALNHAIAANFLKSIIARLFFPGCQQDLVFVLEGEQGLRKSSMMRVLVGDDYFHDTVLSVDQKEFVPQMQGKILIELSEGSSTRKVDVNKLKGFITLRSDTFRNPYAIFNQAHPRTSVFCKTVNDKEYLSDITGDRRFVPIEPSVDSIDLEWLKAHRELLFAEAYHRVIVLKETWHEFPDGLKELQASKTILPAIYADIEKWFNQKTQAEKLFGVTTNEGYHSLGSSKIMSKGDEYWIVTCYKHMGLTKEKKQANGSRVHRWYKAE